MTLAPRLSYSSDFSHREVVFLAPLSCSFYHVGRDPNVPTCQRLRFGMRCGNRRSSPSLAESVVFLSCLVSFPTGPYFLCCPHSSLHHVDSSCRHVPREDVILTRFSCVMDEFCSLPPFRLVSPSVL